METSDITVSCATDEIRGTNTRLDTTNVRLEALETRVDGVDGRLVGVESAITSLHRDVARLRPIGDGDPRR